MTFMVREVVADDHGRSWEFERFGPYSTRPDAMAQAQDLASRFDIPGDTEDRYNGEADW